MAIASGSRDSGQGALLQHTWQKSDVLQEAVPHPRSNCGRRVSLQWELGHVT